MIIHNNSIRLTDQEATELAQALLAVVERRSALIAAEPTLANWADNAVALSSNQGTIGITVCAI